MHVERRLWEELGGNGEAMCGGRVVVVGNQQKQILFENDIIKIKKSSNGGKITLSIRVLSRVYVTYAKG